MRPFKFKKPRDVELSANMGHQRTFHDVRVASALPPKADIRLLLINHLVDLREQRR
jgi:hypothetical protein